MKRIIILAVIVALILGVFTVTATSAKSPANPPPFQPEIVEIPICDALTLEPGERFSSEDWIDAKGFRFLKVYAYFEPKPPFDDDNEAEHVKVIVCDSPEPSMGTWASFTWNEWQKQPSPTPPPHWSGAILLNDPIYSNIKFIIKNDHPDTPIKVFMTVLAIERL